MRKWKMENEEVCTVEVGKCLLVRMGAAAAAEDDDGGGREGGGEDQEELLFGRNSSGMPLALTHSILLASCKVSSMYYYLYR